MAEYIHKHSIPRLACCMLLLAILWWVVSGSEGVGRQRLANLFGVHHCDSRFYPTPISEWADGAIRTGCTNGK